MLLTPGTSWSRWGHPQKREGPYFREARVFEASAVGPQRVALLLAVSCKQAGSALWAYLFPGISLVAPGFLPMVEPGVCCGHDRPSTAMML